MFKHTKVYAGLMLAFGAMSPLSAVAQQALERVEITGTRIKSFDPEGASPITVLGAEQIKFDAVRSVEGLLNALPQVFADQGGSVSNGATGIATVNLRNLTPARTLVLINGRRLPAGSPRDIATDLNQIPVSMIQRIEVLTGGASAIYGSDAVAGVVNFIMKNNFEGIQFEANHSFYNHSQGNEPAAAAVRARNFALPGDIDSDGKITDFALTLGGNFANGKGNAIVVFTYKKEDALLQSERDFSACSLGLAAAGTAFSCAGSGTSFPGRFLGARDLTIDRGTGLVRNYVGATDAYNFGPLNYFQRPSNRYGFNAQAHYDITDKARAYTEFSFHDDHTVAQIAPSGLFGFDASGANAVRFENPLLSADWRTNLGLLAPGDTAEMLIFRRNVEGGGRQDDIRHTSYRGVIGVKGDIGAWSYDAFAQLGRVVYQETYKNDFSIARSARALDVITDPATGLPACRSFVDGSDPSCVPYDIWTLGNVTSAALGYVSTPGFQKGFTAQRVVGASVSADLGTYGLKVPMAKNGIAFAAGLEFRKETLELETDTAFTTGDLAGQGGPTIGVAGEYSVKDIFGEVKVPLIENRPFAHLLAANASYRNSRYSTGHKTDTYGTGLEWAPVKEVKLRGSYSRAARAANIVELFSAQAIGLYDNDADPCAGAAPIASAADCARTGVTAAQYGTIQDSPAGQYNAIFGGNPNLRPEKSDSYTLGIVASPVKDLTVSVDYFSIKVKDVISNLPAATALQKCLDTGDAQFCSLIHRDRLGTLWATPDAYITATNINLATWKTEGVDFSADYNMKLAGYGGLNVSFNGTYLDKFQIQNIPGDEPYDCAGLYGATVCGTPAPKWRHKLRFTWNTPWNIDAAVTWRYFGKANHESTSSHPTLNGPVAEITKTFGARNYIDVSAAYVLNKNVTFRGSINNLFDKDPPIGLTGAGFGNGNTYPVVYDALGRKISLNMTVTF